MSDFIPKAGGPKVSGLGPKAQKLHALREKAAQAKGGKAAEGATAGSVKTKTLAGTKKISFQRKAT